MAVFFFPYTDYTNYTDYTPYTRYTINPGKTARKRIPVWLIRKIYKRTRSMFQARPCIPACGRATSPTSFASQGRLYCGGMAFSLP